MTILPVLVTGAFLFWFVLDHPGVQHFTLAALVLGLLLLNAGLAHNRMNTYYIDPVIRLKQQLDEPSLLLDPTNFDDGTLVQDLALSLQQQNRRITTDHQDQLALLQKKNLHLTENIAQLSDDHTSTNTLFKQMRLENEIEQSHIQIITDLCREPLMANTGFISLLPEADIGDLPDLTTRIGKAGEEIAFFTGELRHNRYPVDEVVNGGIHQLVDDATGFVAPLLKKRGIVLYPVFAPNCQFEFSCNPALVRATIFNFVLSRMIHQDSANELELTLHIGFSGNKLMLALTPDLNINPQSTRLKELIEELGANLDECKLSIPTVLTKNPSFRFQGVRVKICTQSDAQKISLESRLINLGMILTENDADFCIICHDDHSDIIKLADQLNHKTKVLLLNNVILYNRPRWFQLKDPLSHDELTQVIRKNIPDSKAKRNQKKLQVLALDDNDVSLRLLSVLLRELGHEVMVTNDPMQAIELSKHNRFDLAFMDIQMPRLSGIQTCEIIRSHGLEFPIIALSAHFTESERASITRAGMNGALIKPVNITLLNQTIASFIGDPAESSEDLDATKIFDSSLSMERANYRSELADEFLQLFLQSLPADEEKLVSTFRENNFIEFCKVVHKINGAVRYCGLPRLERAINMLEGTAKQQRGLHAEEITTRLNTAKSEMLSLYTWYRAEQNPFQLPRLNEPVDAQV